jgi:hypothetical protein
VKAVQIYDLATPQGRRTIMTHAGERALEAVLQLGPGFTRHLALPPGTRRIWNAVKIDLTRYEKMDEVLEQLQLDVVRTGCKHFISIPCDNIIDMMRFEKDGVSLRLSMEGFNPKNPSLPGTMLQIEYMGWK